MLSISKIEEILQDTLSTEKIIEINGLEELPLKGLRAGDLSGKKFNQLLVLGRGPQELTPSHQFVRWWCICDCPEHTIVLVRANNLRTGNTKSCGCHRQEVGRLHFQALGKATAKNIAGQAFGELTALEPTEERNNRSVVWKCKCSCGKFHFVSAKDLISKRIESCGHTQDSRGVRKIKTILDTNNIPYVVEKTFETCRFPDSNKPARFDFYIENKLLLEYDGEQHFKEVSEFFRDSLEVRQYHDAYKNQWCKDNHIPLVRIPYTALDDISLETIMGDKYRI